MNPLLTTLSDPAHGAFMLLVLPRTQRGSAVIPRSECRFHRRASSDAAHISNGCASRRALTYLCALSISNGVSCPDPFASAGAHDVLRCHQPA
jgi:hypothetical protein